MVQTSKRGCLGLPVLVALFLFEPCRRGGAALDFFILWYTATGGPVGYLSGDGKQVRGAITALATGSYALSSLSLHSVLPYVV